MKREAWITLLGEDPRPWLASSDEPFARWVLWTELMDLAPDDPRVLECRMAIIHDPLIAEIVSRLPDWEVDSDVPGHNSARFAPNTLNLLADMGLQGSDDPRIERLLNQMEAHRTNDGHYTFFGKAGYGANKSTESAWGWLPCDSHAVAEVLMRYGRLYGSKRQETLSRMESDITATDQGEAWSCLPHSVTGFRGPGRKSEMCPQVTVEALRAATHWKEAAPGPVFLKAAASLLRAWKGRSDRKPYMFGHGISFKTVKWPGFWYNAASVLDALSRYPSLWSGRDADTENAKAVAELAACMVAYNFGPDGKVAPQSCYRGFENFSFGRKTESSPFATARLCSILRRYEAIVHLIRDVDPLTLTGSKGGTGRVVPPKRGRT